MRKAMEEIIKEIETNRNYIPSELNIVYKIAKEAIEADDKERNKMNFTRINNDVNGNPRYVVHFLQCCPDSWKNDNLGGNYDRTVKLMNKIGGRKYHNKSYGGGIVFQSYSIEELENSINKLKESI